MTGDSRRQPSSEALLPCPLQEQTNEALIRRIEELTKQVDTWILAAHSSETDFDQQTLQLESANTRVSELESNERAYEEIIGPMTYRQVADRIKELEGALAPFAEIARELTDTLKDSDKNTMHWAVPTVGNLRAALRILKAGS